MASPAVKPLQLLQLSVLLQLLLLSCFTVFGEELDIVSSAESPHYINAPSYPPAETPKHPKTHHHHHHQNTQVPSRSPVQPPSKPPVQPPSKSPVQPPSKPPAQPPSQPPSYPPPKRSLLAVQGVVYCKPCKYAGVDTLLNATSLAGAVVKLQCNNTKNPLVQQATTDKNGYFFLMAPKTITTFGSHKCKVSLVSSPQPTCSKPTNLHYGLKGAILMPPTKQQPDLPQPLPFELFTVGPFAFEPATKCTY